MQRALPAREPLDDIHDEVHARCVDVDDAPLLLEQTLELRWLHVALEVEVRRVGERAGDGFGELGGVCGREDDLDC